MKWSRLLVLLEAEKYITEMYEFIRSSYIRASHFEGRDLTDKGTKVDELRQKMGMVFQNFNLFPHKKGD